MSEATASAAFEFSVGYGWILIAALVLLLTWGRRLFRGLLTLRGFAATPALSRRLSAVVGSRDFSEEEFLGADGADERWVQVRREAFHRLADQLNHRSPKSAAWNDEIRQSLSDLRFADANRVPFPFARLMRERFNTASVATRADGPYLYDLDGNRSLDVSGSYGVNVAGYDKYKEWIEAGWQQTRDLGAVLGPLHPLVRENIELLKQVSGKEEISFHVSGTEAVMAAVRLARFNTRRKKIVCFSGAFHGWWDGVQPGLGSERPIDDCLTLQEMKPGSLEVIRSRASEIAGVLINPVQSFHPNSPPPNDAVLLSSEVRKTQDIGGDYAQWLRRLAEVCRECGIPLIFDEVYSGFRLAPGGAQEYFGVEADMVLYGKTVAGGLPIGVVCGPKALMQRFDVRHPMRIAYVVGTFSAYPLAMGAMNAFLNWAMSAETAADYERANAATQAWVRATNDQLAAAQLPLRVEHLGSIWTVVFTRPSRYNWLLQYYLRAEGVNLSWVGTGRCLISMDFGAAEFDLLRERLCAAAQGMRDDKWWLTDAEQPDQEKKIRTRLIKDMVAAVIRFPRPVQAFCQEIMRRKHDDHLASHSHPTNQFLHMLSSTAFIACYLLLFFDVALAVWVGVISLFVRQLGHALIEPPCHDAEQLLLGFDTRSKTVVVCGFLLIPAVNWWLAAPGLSLGLLADRVAEQWFAFSCVVILSRVLLLIRRYGLRLSMVWFLKLVTDPFTDLHAYRHSLLRPFPRQSEIELPSEGR